MPRKLPTLLSKQPAKVYSSSLKTKDCMGRWSALNACEATRRLRVIWYSTARSVAEVLRDTGDELMFETIHLENKTGLFGSCSTAPSGKLQLRYLHVGIGMIAAIIVRGSFQRNPGDSEPRFG